MPRDLPAAQLANVSASVTAVPIYLVEISHSGVLERLSSSREVTFDGDLYAAAGVRVLGVADASSADIELPWSPTRVQEVQSGAWRGGACRVWVIPVNPESDATEFGEEEATQLLDGTLRASVFSGSAVRVRAEQVSAIHNISPRHTFSEVCNHIPAPGSQLNWEGETLPLESRQFSAFNFDFNALQGKRVGDGRAQLLRNIRQVRGELSAVDLRERAPTSRDRTLTATAENAPIPIIFGTTPVPGNIIAIGYNGANLLVGVGWGYGPIDGHDDIYINDEALPISGVSVTHYLGTTAQTADPKLTAAIATYSDDVILRTPQGDVGVAYSVFEIEPGAISGAPRFQAVTRGLHILDAAGTGTAYSANTALCFAHLARNPIYGMGVSVTGVAECEAWNDSLLGGAIPRCRLGLPITSPARTRDHLDTLATYGELHWYWEGSAIVMVPDRKVDETNPMGLEAVRDGSFTQVPYATEDYFAESYVYSTTNNAWDLGDGCELIAGAATWDGSQAAESAASQTLAIQPGKHSVGFSIVSRSAGSVGLKLDGVEVIAAQTAVDEYRVLHEIASESVLLELVASADFVGSVDLATCKRLYWLETNCIAGTLNVEGVDDGDTPTRVKVQYSKPSSSSGYWPEATTDPQSLPGVAEGEIQAVDSTLAMLGVYRAEEAANKAAARLQKMKNRVRVTWQTTDAGLRHRKSDVIQHKMAHRGTDILVRLTAANLIGPGRYEVTGLRYDDAHYPSELILPEGTGTIPVGAILPLSGSTVPGGWADYSAANDRYIVGAGGIYTPGDTGGAASVAGFSGVTSTDDMHQTPGPGNFDIEQGEGTANLGVARFFDTVPSPDTDHHHSVTIPGFTPTPPRRDQRLVIKTGAAATAIPREVQTFGLPTLSVPGLSRITAAASRLLRAAAASTNAGSAQTSSGNTGYAGEDHNHMGVGANREPGLASADWVYDYLDQGKNHRHSWSIAVSVNVKRRTVALWGAGEDYPIVPGMIALWAGSLGSLPADWVLCDGSGTTPDLTDYFIEIAPEGGEDIAAGDNTISITGYTGYWYHQHRGDGTVQGVPRFETFHSGNSGHRHQVSFSAAWTPPYYALAAIMFDPS